MDDLHLHTDVKGIQKSDPLSAAIGWLRGDTSRPPVVLDGQRPYGIPNRQGLMSRRLDQNAKIQRYTQPVPIVAEDDDLDGILVKFSETLAPYLPYAEKGALKGYVAPIDLLYRLEDGPSAAKSAEYVEPLRMGDTMGEALHRFHGETADEIPVVDTAGRIQGVLARRAVLEIADAASMGHGRTDLVGENDKPLESPVSGYMDPGWFEIPPATPFRAMLPSLKSHETLYVTTDGAYAGLVTAPYLCRVVQRSAGQAEAEARQWFNLRQLEIPERRPHDWARERQSH